LVELLSQSSAELSNVSDLSICVYDLQPNWRSDGDHSEWLELFRQFPAVETLQVTQIARPVADALNDVSARMVPEILPSLRLLYLELEDWNELGAHVEKFVSARRLFGLPPVTITDTREDFVHRRGEYFWE
jgi:hypothetical protein